MEYRITPGRLEIGNFSLYYERVGGGAPIVFLHGLGGNHLSWWQQVPYFMRSFECVTVDQRGFGLSPDPDGLFNRAHASDLGALLDHLKINKAVLVGQSMGGWTIVGYALEHPERVAAMVMADTPGGIFTPEMKFDRPREPLPVDASPPIGSLPTYASVSIIVLLYARAAVNQLLTMTILCMFGEQNTLITPDIVKALATAP